MRLKMLQTVLERSAPQQRREMLAGIRSRFSFHFVR